MNWTEKDYKNYLKSQNKTPFPTKAKKYIHPQTLLTASESEEQIELFRWAEHMTGTYPELVLIFHIPNGGLRNKGVAGKLKAEGVKSGVPDVCLPVARSGYHALYIEMKAGKNSTTIEQDYWIAKLREQGSKVKVCYGWESAAKTIEEYLQKYV